jgi:predicted nuclease of predicted toxin-antitoxin system
VRFLVDECLPVRLAAALRATGHDAVHVVEAGLHGATDDKVMATAELRHSAIRQPDQRADLRSDLARNATLTGHPPDYGL